ncbi:MAG: hypothetical protein M5U33_06460 [Pseudorhodoplanes sp.]|nr:hypothetical protein [Pseudorhodoplanes sp.]
MAAKARCVQWVHAALSQPLLQATAALSSMPMPATPSMATQGGGLFKKPILSKYFYKLSAPVRLDFDVDQYPGRGMNLRNIESNFFAVRRPFALGCFQARLR